MCDLDVTARGHVEIARVDVPAVKDLDCRNAYVPLCARGLMATGPGPVRPVAGHVTACGHVTGLTALLTVRGQESGPGVPGREDRSLWRHQVFHRLLLFLVCLLPCPLR